MSRKAPELVIGLVGAAGTALDRVVAALTTALREVSYETREIRLSHLIHDYEPYDVLSSLTEYEEYLEKHMTAGDEIRNATCAEIMALLALAEIRVFRRDRNGGEPEDAEDQPVPRVAYILKSLKRPEEVTLLRKVYGAGALIISAYASRETRKENLAGQIAQSKGIPIPSAMSAAEHFIARDENEADVPLGQNVRDTFHLADIFLDADQRSSIESSVRRAISIVFGHPFETPTQAEIGMQFARSAALRSSDLSRQVGYAACTSDGQLLATGANEVAKAGGGAYWPGEHDNRDFQFGERESNAELKTEILADLLRRLEGLGVTSERKFDPGEVSRFANELKQSLFMSITEYGRAVHAEMSVITDAARRGISLEGATMYGTTFPCHNCAKHVVAAGIRELVYIEPYPKSQVARLYRDSISLEQSSDQKVSFRPFVGIAPQRYSELFAMLKRKRDDGTVLRWEDIRHEAVPRVFSDPAAYIPQEISAMEELGSYVASGRIRVAAETRQDESEGRDDAS